jgi:hypothetical protein
LRAPGGTDVSHQIQDLRVALEEGIVQRCAASAA